MKKSLFLKSLTLVMLALFAVVTVACNHAPLYTVVLDYNAEQGSLVLSPAEQDGKYAEGTTVTVTVTPKSGYELDSFSVTGITDAAPNSEGKFTFTVSGDTTVHATFREEVSATCTLTLSYDHAKGSVSVSPQAPADGYEPGTQITLTVVPEEGYAVESFSVGGQEDAVLTPEGNYTFQIVADTAVSVVFQPANGLSKEDLSALQGSALFEGKMINHDYAFGDELETDLMVLFDAAHNAIWQAEKIDGDYSFNAIYMEKQGKVALVTHDEQGRLLLQDSNDNFADYFNPFALLTPLDFTLAEENVWELSSDKAQTAATAITGYEENIASFRIFRENGVFVKLEIKTVRVTNPDKGLDHEYEYTFGIKELGTASVPQEWLADYTMTEQHEALKQALTAAAGAGSYTVTQKRVEEGYDDVNSKIYVTENAIYEDTEGWENGYTVFDGTVYPFDYDPSTQTTTFGEAYPDVTIDDLKAVFLFDPLPYSLVGYDGNEQYSVRIPDLFIMEYPGELAGAIAQLFAIGTDQIEYYTYALDCTILLQDGVLYQVHFTYDLMGYIREDVTLTFSDFGSTVLPIEIKDEPEPEPAPSTDIPPQFIGKFKGLPAGSYFTDGTDYEIEITANSITVKIGANSYTAEIEDYDEYEGFTLTVNGKTYYLSVIDDEETVNQIMFASEDYSVMIKLERDGGAKPGPTPSAKIPSQFIGTFKGLPAGSGFTDGTDYEIEITADSITVKIGANSYTAEIEDYDDYEGFTLMVNGKTYYLSSMNYDGTADELMFMSDDYSVMIKLERDGGAEPGPTPSTKIPSQFIGTFKGLPAGSGFTDGTSYEIVITADAITVKIGANSYTAEIEDYDESEGFTLTVNGKTYYLSSMTYDGTADELMFMSDDYSVMIKLNRDGSAQV